MGNEKQVDSGRRGLLVATCAAGGVVGLSATGAFVSTFQPSERAKAAGDMTTAEWRGKPVWILKRTPEMMASLNATQSEVADPDSTKPYTMPLPDYCEKQSRSRKEHEDILIAVGICSHLGCSPSKKFTPGAQPSLPDNWAGGFLCPCHGSTFDLSGRVFKNKPAPQNLDVPRHMYLSDTKIVIGKDEKGEA